MPRLRRTFPDQPGWTRRRSGKGFVYLDEHGNRLDAEQVQRCKDLVIPPAWKDVWITPHPNGHLQAVGTDDAGRRQYLYHPQWRASRDAAKFDRILGFGKALSKARERVLTDIGAEGMSQERACAVAVRLLDLGYFRIGNDVYTDTNGSFGLTTLLREHVSRRGSALHFRFVGKSGIEHDIDIDDKAAIEALDVMRRRRGGGDRLLAWKDGRTWRDLSSSDVNDYIRGCFGIEATAKDFRTWHATVIAASALAETDEPGTDQGLPQARGVRRHEGGLGVPRQHPDPGAHGVRRPAGRRGLRAGPDDQGPRLLRHRRRAAGGARARRAQAAGSLSTEGLSCWRRRGRSRR